MCGLQKLQPAVLDVGNIAANEFDLQPVTVMRAPEQHGLTLQLQAFLASSENRLDDILGLGVAVLDRNVTGFAAFRRLRPQALLVLALASRYQAISAVQNRLRGPVVLLQRNDPGGRRILRRETEDIVDLRSTERVDGLCVVADNGQPPAVGFQRRQYLRLQQVGVLVLIDEDVIEPGTDFAGKVILADQVAPVQQQVVVVEHLVLLLAHDVVTEQQAQLIFPFSTPRVGVSKRLFQRLPGIDASRIDGKAGVFLREAARFLRQPELVTDDIHQVGCIAAIENREPGIQSQILSEPAQQAVADRVKCARPGQDAGRQCTFHPVG